MAWTSVITNAGRELIGQWAQGASPIRISRCAGGEGMVPESALLAQTALQSERQTGEIAQTKTLSKGTQIKLQFPAVETAYTLNQIGLFAEMADGEVLLAIYQNADGVSIYDIEESENFLFSFYAVLGVSNEAQFQVVITSGAVVTMDVLEDRLSSFHQEELDALLSAFTVESVERAFTSVFSYLGEPHPMDGATEMDSGDVSGAISKDYTGDSTTDSTAMSAAEITQALGRKGKPI